MIKYEDLKKMYGRIFYYKENNDVCEGELRSIPLNNKYPFFGNIDSDPGDEYYEDEVEECLDAGDYFVLLINEDGFNKFVLAYNLYLNEEDITKDIIIDFIADNDGERFKDDIIKYLNGEYNG